MLNISCPEVADGGVVTAKYGNAVYATIARNGACSMNLPLGLWDLEHGNIMNRISVPEFGVYNIDFSSSKRMTSPTGLTAADSDPNWTITGSYKNMAYTSQCYPWKAFDGVVTRIKIDASNKFENIDNSWAAPSLSNNNGIKIISENSFEIQTVVARIWFLQADTWSSTTTSVTEGYAPRGCKIRTTVDGENWESLTDKTFTWSNTDKDAANHEVPMAASFSLGEKKQVKGVEMVYWSSKTNMSLCLVNEIEWYNYDYQV